MEYIPKVLQAVAGEDFTIYLYFAVGYGHCKTL